MVEILPNLLLGSKSDVLYLLGRRTSPSPFSVTHLLSILNKPIDWSEVHTPQGVIVAKLLVAPDMPSTDLLTHFPTCVSFITDALEVDKGTILVHCEYGISRSTTIVLAYIMKKKGLNFTQAMELVREKKPDVRPNSGFVHQLKLWYTMGYILDDSNKVLKAYRLHHQARTMKEAGYMKSMEMLPDPSSASATSNSRSSNSYSCRKCRRLLFDDKDTLQHQIGSGFERRHDIDDFWSSVVSTTTANKSKLSVEEEEEKEEEVELTFISDKLRKVTIESESQRLRSDLKKLRSDVAQIAATMSHDSHMTCSSLFIEPVEWMAPLIVGHKDGKLLCPKCSARIGSFDWAGSQCSCGRWVTPSFQIHKSKIDFKL